MVDLRSNKTVGFHLFLEPTGELADELAAIIKTLSAEYGGPVFTPHVTLLARIEGEEKEVIEKSQILADKLSPITLTLGTLDIKDAFFKALYMQIEEVGDMKKYHAQANEIFSMQDEGEYVPHLSLLYGNYEKEQKETTIKDLIVPQGKAFLADRMHLYKTEGPAENWQKIQEFILGA